MLRAGSHLLPRPCHINIAFQFPAVFIAQFRQDGLGISRATDRDQDVPHLGYLPQHLYSGSGTAPARSPIDKVNGLNLGSSAQEANRPYATVRHDVIAIPQYVAA